MKKAFMAFCIITGLIVIGYLSGSLWAEGENAVIMLEVQGGQVQVKSAGAEEFADVTGTIELKIGDVIKSFPDSKSRVLFGDSTFVAVKPGTEMEIKMNGFRIKQGKTWVSFIKKGGTFEIITPTATVGIRGTELSVEVTEALEEIVTVVSGMVSVKRGDGEPVNVPAGKMISYRPEDTANPNPVDIPAEALAEFRKLVEEKLLPVQKEGVDINELEGESTGTTVPGKKEDYKIDILQVKPDSSGQSETSPTE